MLEVRTHKRSDPRCQSRILALATVTALALAPFLTGCRNPEPQANQEPEVLPTTIYMAVAIDDDDAITSKVQQALRHRLARLQRSFQDIHPRVELELLLFAEDRLVQEVRRRNRSGLGPDLLMVEADTARKLAALGLTRPVRFPAAVLDQLDPAMLGRLALGGGELAGLPWSLQPQLACFNRARMARSPATLQELLQASAEGRQVGLGGDLMGLAWTLGALGAHESVAAFLEGGPGPPDGRQRISGWLQWLRNADLQQRVSFLPSQEKLLEGLTAGELDWITCRSIHISALRSVMGPRLGVASLPAGPAGDPSPISALRVFAFGTNSSARQRRAAEALAAFTINPQVQRSLIVTNREVLPVNRHVQMPVESSSELAALVTSHQQATLASTLPLSRLLPAQAKAERTLIRFLYGDLEEDAATDLLITALGSRGTP
jgi:ABC-type glycerol-3-phosphate transport system substrate-binding protein